MLQSKSLIGEHSVGFSPPSLLRETLIDTWDESVTRADISQSSTTTSVVFFINAQYCKLNCSILIYLAIVSDLIYYIEVMIVL